MLPPLLGAMNRHQDKASLLRHSAWLLSNLCRPKPQTDDLFVSGHLEKYRHGALY